MHSSNKCFFHAKLLVRNSILTILDNCHNMSPGSALFLRPVSNCLIRRTLGTVFIQESHLHHPSAHRFLHRHFSTTVPSVGSGVLNRTLGPRVQHPAPDFKGTAVVESAFKPIQLSDFHGKYLILLFYPLDFTFVCPTEIVAFSDRADDFRKLKTEVVAISTDSHFSHLAWTNVPRSEGGLGPMKISLLSDFTKQISRYIVLRQNVLHMTGHCWYHGMSR